MIIIIRAQVIDQHDILHANWLIYNKIMADSICMVCLM